MQKVDDWLGMSFEELVRVIVADPESGGARIATAVLEVRRFQATVRHERTIRWLTLVVALAALIQGVEIVGGVVGFFR